ncbi:MAG: NAD(P)/FAD-dependent oxidoreductase [Spirochaetales bacterium]|nr:NAD(P)/FAD-dependent oxidoreductase [Spirochaetales bacterium]
MEKVSIDVLILGSGTAGQTAAAALAGHGLSVGLADSGDFGGTCALRGCQPKKYLVVPAHAALEGKALVGRGFRNHPELVWEKMQKARKEFTDAVPQGTKDYLTSLGVQVFDNSAEFLDVDTFRVGAITLKPQRVLIATGARPRPLVIPGGEFALSSDDFLYQDDLPDHLVFIGGGYISLEFATVALAAGKRVSLVHRGSGIMEPFDPDLVAILQNRYTEEGIRLYLNDSPTSIEQDSKGFTVVLESGERVKADRVFANLGRIPNTDSLGVGKGNILLERGAIQVSPGMRTSNPRVYAAGDCTVGIQLAPVSDAQARIAAHNILEDITNAPGRYKDLNLDVLPTVVFTYPQLAQFGYSESRALACSKKVRINRGSGAGWPNYRRLNEKTMEYKIMIDEESGQILGAHILAPQAGELINLLALAALQGISAQDFAEIPWAYPTYTADLKYMLG